MAELLASTPIPVLKSRHDLVTANVIEEHSHLPERVTFCIPTQTGIIALFHYVSMDLSVGGTQLHNGCWEGEQSEVWSLEFGLGSFNRKRARTFSR